MQIEKWTRYHAAAMLLATFLFVFFNNVLFFLVFPVASFLFFIITSRQEWQVFGWWGGLANVITSLRWLTITWLVWQAQAIHPYVIFVLGILTLVADGLDGYYARKYHTVSVFGDSFDKETDAFFVLAYGVMISQRELAGHWVLLPGLLRYGYVLLLAWRGIKSKTTASSFRRQFMGMWLMGTLLAPFVITPIVYIPSLIFAIGMVFYSFGKDLKEMWWPSEEKVII